MLKKNTNIKVKLSKDQEFYGELHKKGKTMGFSEKAYKELNPKGVVQKDK